MELILSFIAGYLLCFMHTSLSSITAMKQTNDSQTQWQKLLNFSAKGGNND